MENKRKMCAVCGTKTQSNIIFAWERDSDKTVFHICGMCAEAEDRVTEHTVQIKETGAYTTVRG